jgi:NAD-dependent histone deacetylase SIR2
MLLPRITTQLQVTRPRQLVPHTSNTQILNYTSFNIGRKHKAHRQQLAQDKPSRESEKGRKGKGKGKGRSKMGNEESRVVDADTPPRTLKARTIEALAQYIKDGRAKKIVVMVRSSRSSQHFHSR